MPVGCDDESHLLLLLFSNAIASVGTGIANRRAMALGAEEVVLWRSGNGRQFWPFYIMPLVGPVTDAFREKR